MDHRTRSHPTLTPLTNVLTSPSYIYPTTSIPSTPSLLSRPSSSTRLRPLHSAPTALRPASKSSTTLSKPPRKYKDKKYDDDWITRTASTLTLTRLEEKGQSWLAARHSSTSLTGEDEEEGFHSPPEWRGPSARGSARRLQLGNPRSRRTNFGGDGAGEDVAVEPDFVDGWEEDEEAEEVEVDEGEMRKVVMGRVGGWVDWAVGWLDLRGDEGDDEGEGEGEREGGEQKGELDPVELQRRLRRKKKRDEEVGMDAMVGRGVRAAPEGERAGTWSDAQWLLHVAMAAAVE